MPTIMNRASLDHDRDHFQAVVQQPDGPRASRGLHFRCCGRMRSPPHGFRKPCKGADGKTRREHLNLLPAFKLPAFGPQNTNGKEKPMSQKLLLAFAACLPLALAACSGGGGASSSAAPQTPSGGSGTQTPAAALEAAKTAVAAANRAKTADAVRSAQRALTAAVETASTAVETAETAETAAQAAVTRARNYRTAQLAILDGLTPIAASASLAAVRAASTPALAEAAYAAARDAVANAIATETQEAIDAARRALENALAVAVAAAAAAEAALAEARGDLQEARDYREIQAAAVAAIQTQPEQTPSTPSGGSVFRLHGLDVTHLEMTDPYWHVPGISTTYTWSVKDGPSQRTAADARLKLVCPGVRPDLNKCTAEVLHLYGSIQTDFDIESRDYSASTFHESLTDVTMGNLDASRMFGSDYLASVEFWYAADNCARAQGTPCGSGDERQRFGGKGRHSFFYSQTTTGDGTETVAQTFAAAMGYLSPGRPRRLDSETGATATWSGGMIGRDMRQATPLVGDAEVEFSFADNTVDVTISEIRKTTVPGFDSYADYNGPEAFEWAGLRVNSDASFYIPGFGNDRSDTDLHPVYGYIDGDFYGAGAEEVAGVFERAWVSGAFLALRGEEIEAPSGGYVSGNTGSGADGSRGGGSGGSTDPEPDDRSPACVPSSVSGINSPGYLCRGQR